MPEDYAGFWSDQPALHSECLGGVADFIYWVSWLVWSCTFATLSRGNHRQPQTCSQGQGGGLLTSLRSLVLACSKPCLSLPVFLCLTPAFGCHTFFLSAFIKLKNGCYLPAPELHSSIYIFNSVVVVFIFAVRSGDGRLFKLEQLDVCCLRRCELAGQHECWELSGNFCSFLSLRLKCGRCSCLPVCKYRYSKYVWYFCLKAHLALGKWASTPSLCAKRLCSSLMDTEMEVKSQGETVERDFTWAPWLLLILELVKQSLQVFTAATTVPWRLRTSCWGLREQGRERYSLWPRLAEKAELLQIAS